jgi:hypothetical protein
MQEKTQDTKTKSKFQERSCTNTGKPKKLQDMKNKNQGKK